MHQRKSKKLLIYFFLLIIISSINNTSLKNLEFQKVRNIEVSGLSEIENSLIIEKIKNLNLDNIFFINKKEINNLMDSNPLIEKYMSDNSISILIDKKNIFIADKNFDITKNLVDLIDTNFKN